VTRRPWLGLVALALLAGGVCGAGLPDPPRARVAVPVALALGCLSGVALAGLALFTGDVRRRPGRRRLATSVGLAAVLVVAAACEEVVWRAGVQAAVGTVAGTVGALVLTALLFGAVHGPLRRRMATQVLTGVAFGTVFAVSGRLVAAMAAHGAYNLTLLAWDSVAGA